MSLIDTRLKIILLVTLLLPTITASACVGCCAGFCPDASGSCGSACCSTSCDSCGCTSCGDCNSCCSSGDFCNFGKTWFSQRDQGSYQYLVMELTAENRHQFDKDKFYGDFAITAGWQQNFNKYRLSSYFLTPCGSLSVGANAPNGYAPYANVRASDLGLSTTFTGCAWLCPTYQDFLADFDLYVGWDGLVQGLWTELRVPFIYTRWNFGLGTCAGFEGGAYYATNAIEQNQYQYVVDADSPNPVPVVYTGSCALSSALLGNCSFGDAPRLQAGKMINCRRTLKGLGGVRFEIGYDFYRRERGSMGIAFDVEFPAANKPQRCNCGYDLYIFDANIGSQHEWKFGGVLRAQYMLWNREEDDKRIDFYFDGRVAAACSGKTTRLLGLQANNTVAFNHYLLLKKYDVKGSTATYVGLERAANKLCGLVEVGTLAEGQITAMLQYAHNNFVFGLGYNFFGRGQEKLSLCGLCNSDCCDYYYVIKGDLPIRTTDEETPTDAGFYSASDTNISQTGTRVPLASDAWGAITASAVTENALNFNCCACGCGNGNITLCPAAHPRYICNTLFGHIGHHWDDVTLKPYIGILGKVDFGSSNTALRLWGVYLKGGLCF